MRARNLQTLTDQLKAKYKGVVIYGVGDDAHKTRISDHNEDDTPGVRAEQPDEDNIPEHRAIDVMIGEAFDRQDAQELFEELTTNSTNQHRLTYVIYNRKIRSKSNNWVEREYDGSDPHTSHVHVSGLAAQDENTTPFTLTAPPAPKPTQLRIDGQLGPKTITRWQQVMHTPADGVISEDSALVRKVQQHLKDTVDHRLVVDGDGNSFDTDVPRKTVFALQRYLKTPVDGIISTPRSLVIEALQRRLNQNRF